MIHVVLDILRSKLSSMSSGMDDQIDRLTRKTTILMMIFGALVIGSNRYFGTPISCATTELPHGISQQWIDTYCWLSDKQAAPIQTLGNNHIRVSTSFYQFTVETLILLIVVLSIPSYLWNVILGRSGYKLKRIAALIEATKQSHGSIRMANLKELANQIKITRHYHRLHWSFDQELQRLMLKLKESNFYCQFHRKFWYQNKYFLPIMYICTKINYIIAITGLFWILEFCLGFNYIHLGIPIIRKLFSKNTTTFFDETYFPQRSWCLITRQKLGRIDETWADCILPINVINNIIFSLMWFWLWFLLFVSIYGLIRSFISMLPFSSRLYLAEHLRAHDQFDMQHNAAVHDFIQKCSADVILMLRLYEVDLGCTLTGEIVAQLFVVFKNDYELLETSLAQRLP